MRSRTLLKLFSLFGTRDSDRARNREICKEFIAAAEVNFGIKVQRQEMSSVWLISRSIVMQMRYFFASNQPDRPVIPETELVFIEA